MHKVTLSENISLEICSIHKSHDHAQGNTFYQNNLINYKNL